MTDWIREQERYLIQNYSKLPIDKLKIRLKRKNKAIHAKVKRLRKRGIYIIDRKIFV